MAIQKAECGISVGDKIDPDNPLHKCSALATVPAPMGLEYLGELGGQRSQVVDRILEAECERARGIWGEEDQRNDPYCPDMKEKAVVGIVEIAESGWYTPEEIRKEIADLSSNFRWAAQSAVQNYLTEKTTL